MVRGLIASAEAMEASARNFVIIYSGRTGSSPIINILARQPGVRVPVFEDLDQRKIGKDAARKIVRMLDRTFTDGCLPDVRPRYLPSFRAQQWPLSIGFKWRPFGDREAVCDVFKRHGVILFVLSRRDFIELTSTLYITTFGNRLQNEIRIRPHPQFALTTGPSAPEREDIDRLQSMRFPVYPVLLRRVMRQQARVRGDLLELAQQAHRRGIPVRTVYYEDFTADNERFIRRFLNEIGVPPADTVDTECSFQKVMKVPARTRLRGLDWWLWLPPLQSYVHQYADLGTALEQVAAASRSRETGVDPAR